MQIASQNSIFEINFSVSKVIIIVCRIAIICKKIAIVKSSYRKQQLDRRRLMTMRNESYCHCDSVMYIYKNINRVL